MSPFDKLDPTPAPEAADPRKNPGELGLSLSAAVLRLPIQISARFVLAEIIRLHHACPRGCDASDQYFADRLTLSLSAVGRAMRVLFGAELIGKTVDGAPGSYRVLTPCFEAIETAARS